MNHFSAPSALFISDPVHAYSSAQGKVGPVPRRAVAALDARTDAALRAISQLVAQDLATEFAELRARAVEVLSASPGAAAHGIPRAVQVEIHDLAARIAWQPVARAATLELLTAALELAAPVDAAASWSAAQWAEATVVGLDRDRFAEYTGLEGREPDRALRTAARTILSWPGLLACMPLLFHDVCLTLRPS